MILSMRRKEGKRLSKRSKPTRSSRARREVCRQIQRRASQYIYRERTRKKRHTHTKSQQAGARLTSHRGALHRDLLHSSLILIENQGPVSTAAAALNSKWQRKISSPPRVKSLSHLVITLFCLHPKTIIISIYCKRRNGQKRLIHDDARHQRRVTLHQKKERKKNNLWLKKL